MEVLVSCTLMTILAAIAVPRYAQLALQMRTGAVATQILSDIAFARQQSERTGVIHYIDVSGGTGVNYTVKRSAAPPAIQPSTDPVVRSSQLGTRMPGVSFSTNGVTADPYGGTVSGATPATRMSFNARGLPNNAGSYFVASSDGQRAYAISVTGAGRVRLFMRSGGSWR